VLIPLVLLFFATLAAGVMTYGTHAGWAQFAQGYEFILLARRLQWPMAVLSLALCIALLGLIISGRRRAWWLIGLGPVMALFAQRFAWDPAGQFLVVERPSFVSADRATFVADQDWVVGLRFADDDYAFPYSTLYAAPVVIHAEHDKRLAVMWSAYANRALAVQIGRDLRGADLDVVSMPANALLLYNRRLGQFINALTGLTPSGERPDGFRENVPVTKSTWKAWRTHHPDTKVLAPIGAQSASAPRGPIRPMYPLPIRKGQVPTFARIVVVGTQQPIAIPAAQVTTTPMNLTADGMPVLVFRDARDGTVRAFARLIDDLRPQFRQNKDRKRSKAQFVDKDTGAGWSADGIAVDGPAEMRGRRLAAVPAEDDLYAEVMEYWYPRLKNITPGS
jgi:hypothetical protein